jgi:hypothetical protein
MLLKHRLLPFDYAVTGFQLSGAGSCHEDVA